MSESDFRLFRGSYIVYENGDVFSVKNKKFIEPVIDSRGYSRFSPNGKSMSIHRAVMECFEGENESEIDHVDGNKQNNHITNLEYVTRSENMKRAWKNGLRDKKHCFKKKPVTWNGMVFNSGRELSEFLGLNKGACSVAISNKGKLCGHYVRLLK